MSRIILFTGKGGVGKTTSAAATALCAAKHGHKTVVMSTDAAHGLGDSLDCSLGPEPIKVKDNLWAQESNILYNLEKHWGTVKKWLSELMVWRGVDEIVAEEIAVLPGMEDLANLLWVYYYDLQKDFDVIIVDCAPTGESLRLLTFPDIFQWWVNKLMPVGRKLLPVASPIVHRLTNIPLPDSQILSSVDELFQQLKALRALLTDPKITTIRLVLNPEKMVIKEAQRTYTYLNLYNYPTDVVICNRIFPEDAAGDYWKKWKEDQANYLQMISERFLPLPILKVPLLKSEVTGIKTLEEIGQHLYNGDDPARIYFTGKPMDIEHDKTGYSLILDLPFVASGDISMTRTGDELYISIGNQRRNIILPQALQGQKLKGAKMHSGKLHIRFEEN